MPQTFFKNYFKHDVVSRVLTSTIGNQKPLNSQQSLNKSHHFFSAGNKHAWNHHCNLLGQKLTTATIYERELNMNMFFNCASWDGESNSNNASCVKCLLLTMPTEGFCIFGSCCVVFSLNYLDVSCFNLRDVEGCWEISRYYLRDVEMRYSMLGDVEKYWGVLRDVEGGVLRDVERCWGMLRDAEGCWEMLRGVEKMRWGLILDRERCHHHHHHHHGASQFLFIVSLL